MEKIIPVTLHSKEDYRNQYNAERLNQELIDYFVGEVKAISLKEKPIINIITTYKISKEEKEELVNMIRSYFGRQISELYDINTRTNILDISICAIGILVLVLYFVLQYIPVLSEILLIIGWGLVWEVVYDLLFDRIRLKMKIKKRRKLTACKIHFIEK